MKKVSLILMIALYVVAGINHFVNPEPYRRIMPAWLSLHNQLIFISGIIEILFAVLLIWPATRSFGAWGIIVLLIAVFPANVQMALNYYHEDNRWLWVAVIRLPLQILLVVWAYTFTK